MSRRIAFIGYGRLGSQMAHYLFEKKAPKKNDLLYFEDAPLPLSTQHQYPLKDFSHDSFSDCEFYVCLGYQQLALKKRTLNSLIRLRRKVGSFVHPKAFVEKNTKLGPGVFVYPMCYVGPHCSLELGACLNVGVCLAHDVHVGNCSYLSPSVSISGHVKIGEETFLGTGTAVANDVAIGHQVFVGIGSVVTKSIASNTRAIGNPVGVKEFEVI